MEQMWHFAMQRQEWRIGWIAPSQERIAISYPSYPEVLIIFKLSVSHIPFPYIFIIFALSKPCWTDERSKSRDPSSLGLCLQVGGRAEGWKPTIGQRRARHIYIKGVTVRFGFDDRRTSHTLRIVKNKAMGTPHGVYYIQPSLALDHSQCRCWCSIYAHEPRYLSLWPLWP